MVISKALLASFVLASSGLLAAQTSAPAAQRPLEGAINSHPGWPQPKASDVDSVDHILTALYDVISGPQGQRRDWNRFRSLFVPGARLIPIRVLPGTPDLKTAPGTDVVFLSVDDYVTHASGIMNTEGFFEHGVRNEIDRFGSLVSVFSTYESRHAPGDAQPFARGINSLQLLKDGGRYWIIDICWDAERPGSTIPPRYLPKAGKGDPEDAELTPVQDSSRPAQFFAGEWTGQMVNHQASSTGLGTLGVRLKITPSSDGRAITFSLTYQSGSVTLPADHTMITLFPRSNSATITDLTDHSSQSYAMSGYQEFAEKQGGDLVLTGKTDDNSKPMDARITFSLSPGHLSWRRELRPAGAADDFKPGQEYTLTRSSADNGN